MTYALIAYRMWSRSNPFEKFYVAQLPGEGGKDWGYTTDIQQARELTQAQAERFGRDCQSVGYTSRAIPASWRKAAERAYSAEWKQTAR